VDSLAFCNRHGVYIVEIDNSSLGSLERLNLLAATVNLLISPDPVRKEFLAHERFVRTLLQAVKSDPSVVAFVSHLTRLSTSTKAAKIAELTCTRQLV
jgi:type I restriction enzyme R subunit